MVLSVKLNASVIKIDFWTGKVLLIIWSSQIWICSSRIIKYVWRWILSMLISLTYFHKQPNPHKPKHPVIQSHSLNVMYAMHYHLIEEHSVLTMTWCQFSAPPQYECNPQVTVRMYCTVICFISLSLVPKASYFLLTSFFSGWQAAWMAECEKRLTLTDLI